MREQEQPDPYAVLGVSQASPLPEVRARYRVLAQLFHPDRLQGMPETVCQEAGRRMSELNIAYELVVSRLREQKDSESAVPPRTPQRPQPPPQRQSRAKAGDSKRRQTSYEVNPGNVPLRTLRSVRWWIDRPATATQLWEEAGLEPLMIRLEGGTGLTLCTPLIHYRGAHALFLSDGQRLHVARSAAGLLNLMPAPLGQRLLTTGIRRAAARRIRLGDIVVLPAHRYDVPYMLKSFSDGPFGETMPMLTAVYDLSFKLGIALGLGDVVAPLSPGTKLHSFYRLAGSVNKGVFRGDRAWRKIRQFDLSRSRPR